MYVPFILFEGISKSTLFSSILNFAILSVFSVRKVIIWYWLGAGALISLQPAKSLALLQHSDPCPPPPPPSPPPPPPPPSIFNADETQSYGRRINLYLCAYIELLATCFWKTFLVPCRAMEYIQKRDTEWGPCMYIVFLPFYHRL